MIIDNNKKMNSPYCITLDFYSKKMYYFRYFHRNYFNSIVQELIVTFILGVGRVSSSLILIGWGLQIITSCSIRILHQTNNNPLVGCYFTIFINRTPQTFHVNVMIRNYELYWLWWKWFYQIQNKIYKTFMSFGAL